MRDRVALATWSLRGSAAVYVGLGALIAIFFEGRDHFDLAVKVVLAGLCVLLAIGIEFVVRGLKRRKFWAWVAGICIFGIYLPSLFLPFGVIGMWGLLHPRSRTLFGLTRPDPKGFEVGGDRNP